MDKIYKFLEENGFPRSYAERYLIPEWWEDGLIKIPANRAYIEGHIARQLGVRLEDMRQMEKLTPPNDNAPYWWKRNWEYHYWNVREQKYISE